MVKCKTSTGFVIELDKNVMNNMELVDALAEAENDNPVALSKACLLLLGKDKRQKLYDHLRQEDGRVPVDAVGAALTDIFKVFGDAGKN